MFYHDERLQYPVKVQSLAPILVRLQQQASGGVEGEIRVCMQYPFQSWELRGSTRRRWRAGHRRLDVIAKVVSGSMSVLSDAKATNRDLAGGEPAFNRSMWPAA